MLYSKCKIYKLINLSLLLLTQYNMNYYNSYLPNSRTLQTEIPISMVLTSPGIRIYGLGFLVSCS